MLQRLAWTWLPLLGIGVGVAFVPNLSPLNAQEPGQTNLSAELPRIPPKEPAEAMRAIEIKPGYRLEIG